MPWEVADWAEAGATVKTFPRGSLFSEGFVSVLWSAVIPGAWMPSSFVRRICMVEGRLVRGGACEERGGEKIREEKIFVRRGGKGR